MWVTISVPSAQVTPGIMSFISYVFPPVLGYLTMAVLAVTQQTYVHRVALWPLITLLSVRAAVSVDMSFGQHDQRFHNTLFTFSMLFIVTRTFDWMSAKNALRRRLPIDGSRSVILDSLDLALTLRGHGWDWARKVYFPPEIRPADRLGFVLHTILSMSTHALLCGILHVAIRSFSPSGHGVLSGGSIFDDALLLHVRYLRASIISACVMIGIYAFIQTCYDVCTILALLLLRQDPAQWPPAFESPWYATSVADFWGRRWHQFFRRTFLIQGGYPLSFFVGRVGLLIGTFLSSGVLHHIAMISLKDQLEPWRIIVGFGMMAPAILVEEAFKAWTGKRVRGIVGWIWTMSWLSLWGNIIVDGFARAGVFGGYLSFTESVVPQIGRVGVEHLVASFDSWLHTA